MPAGLSAVLSALVLASALAVVAVKHESRKQFVELQVLERARNELNAQWSRLKIEGGLWSSHDRVQSEAETRLDMVRPPPERVVLVEYRGTGPDE